ncbi:uncharacterized protein LOC124934520 [Impatiens glandulifera]|uniref:uncharacterized protein LOC124934520 n=1 Tax=Impatiens glandulifera TaxID=253017 RepID=UPI001FB0B52F|nr:uncharacterized protein LOC124934520 [Impatiens glandulifera]
MERAMKSQFQYLLKAPTVIFSGTIIHQMLIRKSSFNSKGISFLVNGQQLYWGMKEYALVTGLNFGRFPVIENWHAEECPPLVHKYFGGKTVVKVTEVQSVFLNCSEKEDAWKLGLINLIYQCLFGSNNRKRVCLKRMRQMHCRLRQMQFPPATDAIPAISFHVLCLIHSMLCAYFIFSNLSQEIDAACYILKKRVANFPKTYQPMDFSICDCNVSTRLSLRYSKFSKNPQTYKFDDDLMEYFRGDEGKLMTSWMIVDKVYFPMNLNMKHWVLCEVQLQDWCINVYDCEQGFIKKNHYDKFMKPLCEMIPYMFLFGTTEFDRIKYPKFSLEGMSYVVIPHPRVPKCTKSGDCGLFTIMYLEYLTAKLDISAVTSENIVFWRQKWAVRLFHHIIDP